MEEPHSRDVEARLRELVGERSGLGGPEPARAGEIRGGGLHEIGCACGGAGAFQDVSLSGLIMSVGGAEWRAGAGCLRGEGELGQLFRDGEAAELLAVAESSATLTRRAQALRGEAGGEAQESEIARVLQTLVGVAELGSGPRMLDVAREEYRAAVGELLDHVPGWSVLSLLLRGLESRGSAQEQVLTQMLRTGATARERGGVRLNAQRGGSSERWVIALSAGLDERVFQVLSLAPGIHTARAGWYMAAGWNQERPSAAEVEMVSAWGGHVLGGDAASMAGLGLFVEVWESGESGAGAWAAAQAAVVARS